MQINKITLRNYRNYTDQEICPAPGVNIFLGKNAQGKTNIVEAVRFAALGRSHRTARDAELVKFGADEARAKIEFEKMGVSNTVELSFFTHGRLKARRNGGNIRRKDLVGALNAVLFAPEDLFLIKGAPDNRRRFLDAEMSQASPPYYAELLTYTRLMKQRNTLLKDIRDGLADRRSLSLWTPQMIACAAKLIRRRLAAVKELSGIAAALQQRISGGAAEMSISYVLHGYDGEPDTTHLEQWYEARMRENEELDIIRGTTRIGPHRDDLSFTAGGTDLRAYGSQGQQRTAALSLKLSELEFLRQAAGEYPVLLLDDVMSELDLDRRRNLVGFIERENIQTLITATDGSYFPDHIGKYWHVENGHVTAE